MTQYQRMVVIPQEEYLQMNAVQNVRQPLTQQYYKLESQYNEEDKINDPYKRLMLQSNTLEEMKKLKEMMRNYIVVSTPKPYRSRAQALFNTVESFLKFNERGEIFDKDDNIIPNSRMEDLIQHAVRDRRRHMIPVGWKPFVEILRERNVPKSILNRETLEEIDRPIIIKQEPDTSPVPRKKLKRAHEDEVSPLSRKKLKGVRKRKGSSNLGFLKTF